MSPKMNTKTVVNGKLLPASIGAYRIIKTNELTSEQLAALRSVKRERIEERVRVLVGSGKVAMSQVISRYHDLMGEVERDQIVGNIED